MPLNGYLLVKTSYGINPSTFQINPSTFLLYSRSQFSYFAFSSIFSVVLFNWYSYATIHYQHPFMMHLLISFSTVTKFNCNISVIYFNIWSCIDQKWAGKLCLKVFPQLPFVPHPTRYFPLYGVSLLRSLYNWFFKYVFGLLII